MCAGQGRVRYRNRKLVGKLRRKIGKSIEPGSYEKYERILKQDLAYRIFYETTRET